MTISLTSGGIQLAFNHSSLSNPPPLPEAILQVLYIKQMTQANPNGASADRYKMIVSDGTYFMTGILIFL